MQKLIGKQHLIEQKFNAEQVKMNLMNLQIFIDNHQHNPYMINVSKHLMIPFGSLHHL
jgi:hypothetical protein